MKKYPSTIKKFANGYLKDHYNQAERKEVWEKTLALYEKFIRETPDIGGKKNFMASNLDMAIAFFALYEATGRALTKEEFSERVSKLFPGPIPIYSDIVNLNHKLACYFMNRMYSKYEKLVAEKKANGEWANTWGFEMNPRGRKEGVAFDLIGCPLVDFAKKHGYMEIMPCMCEIDYQLAALMHAKLYRKHTICEGHERCDYWYVGDRS